MPAKEKAIEDKKNILEMCLLNISFKQMVYLKKQNPYNSYWDHFPARIGVHVFEIRVGNYF